MPRDAREVALNAEGRGFRNHRHAHQNPRCGHGRLVVVLLVGPVVVVVVAVAVVVIVVVAVVVDVVVVVDAAAAAVHFGVDRGVPEKWGVDARKREAACGSSRGRVSLHLPKPRRSRLALMRQGRKFATQHYQDASRGNASRR